MNMKEIKDKFYNALKERLDSYSEEVENDDWLALKADIMKRKRLRLFYYSAAAVIVALIGLTAGLAIVDKPNSIGVITPLEHRAITMASSYTISAPHYYELQDIYLKDRGQSVLNDKSEEDDKTERIDKVSIEYKADNKSVDESKIRSSDRNDMMDTKGDLVISDFPEDDYLSVNEKVTVKKVQKYDVSVVGNSSILGENFNTTLLYGVAQEKMISYNTSLVSSQTIKPNNDTDDKVLNLDPDYEYNYQLPVSFGLSFRVGVVNNLFLETGLFATKMKTEVKTGANSLAGNIEFWYVGIPIKASWSFFSSRYFDAYVAGGGSLEKCVSINSSLVAINQVPKDIPLLFSLNANVGFQFNIIPQVSLFFEPGISYFFDKRNPLPSIRNNKPFNVNLQGGLRFNFNI
jgi:hypothetical protein